MKTMLLRMADVLLRGLAYFAVLRPSFVFGAIVVYLPLTVFYWAPGHNILGNLFVDYGFGEGFWFGLALYAAVWAVMLTTCLILDGERDRNSQSDQGREPNPDSGFVHDPGPDKRGVTIPMQSASPFIWFSLLGLPGLLAVCWKADSAILTVLGLAVGVLIAYVLMDIPIYLIRCYDKNFQVLSWPPFGGYIPLQTRLGWFSRGFLVFFSWIASWTPVSPHIFENDPSNPNRKILKGITSLLQSG